MNEVEFLKKNRISLKLYLLYRKHIFPHVSGLKGAHWLNRTLSSSLESVFARSEEEPSYLQNLDWDNLVILDACRYDVYKQAVDEDISYIYSPGSHSREFIQENFSGSTFPDTLYISANPHVNSSGFKQTTGQSLEDVFYDVFLTHETDWNEDLGTVLPSKIERDALTAEKLFPKKRKIIHFMQPHAPLIGSKKTLENINTPASARAAYKENLNFVLREIQGLLEELSGKTVITADHGELLGEKGLYFLHPFGADIEPLRKVPWHVVKK